MASMVGGGKGSQYTQCGVARLGGVHLAAHMVGRGPRRLLACLPVAPGSVACLACCPWLPESWTALL